MKGNMVKEKDKRLSETDKKLGVKILNCQNCNREFYTLHREDKYCPYCVLYKEFKNPK